MPRLKVHYPEHEDNAEYSKVVTFAQIPSSGDIVDGKPARVVWTFDVESGVPAKAEIFLVE